ncbi:hypothetical protein GCM10028807_01050 [Spirosoma daeguense]
MIYRKQPFGGPIIVLFFLLSWKALAQQTYDVVIYGGTPAGVAAAIQVAKLGQSVALLEPGKHLGGIMVEGLGGTDIDNQKDFQNSSAVGGLALEFYRRIAKVYNRTDAFEEVLRTKAKKTEVWRFEPSVAEQVIKDWIAEYKIAVVYESLLLESPEAVSKKGTAIQRIKLANGKTYRGKTFIDATLEGDLLHLAGVSTAIGREANSVYNETKNGIRNVTDHNQFAVKVDPYKTPGDPKSGLIYGVSAEPLGEPGSGDHRLQAYCFRVCMTNKPDNRIAMPKPANYDRKNYELFERYVKAGGKLYKPGANLPNQKTDFNGGRDVSHNLNGMNYAYPAGTYQKRQEIVDYHRNFTQGLFYFLANDPEIGRLDPELQKNWSEWGLPKDEFTDNGGWPRIFYVRDARRMVSDYVITEHHVKKDKPTPVEDPVAMAYWPPDVHNVRTMVRDGYAYNEGFVFGGHEWQPLPISYRALVPKASQCTNLLSASCPSSSHIAYGAIRIEFTFMAMGQACGTAAVLANQKRSTVQKVKYTDLKPLLVSQQQVLGIPN